MAFKTLALLVAGTAAFALYRLGQRSEFNGSESARAGETGANQVSSINPAARLQDLQLVAADGMDADANPDHEDLLTPPRDDDPQFSAVHAELPDRHR